MVGIDLHYHPERLPDALQTEWRPPRMPPIDLDLCRRLLLARSVGWLRR
jgi:hypothetical protein